MEIAFIAPEKPLYYEVIIEKLYIGLIKNCVITEPVPEIKSKPCSELVGAPYLHGFLPI